MTASDKNSDATPSTKDIILDATEEILKTEGYAAVSSRKVAQQAKMKSRVVHYHFGSMDDLFIAMLQRHETRYFDKYQTLLDSSASIEQFWSMILENIDSASFSEITALAFHRSAVRVKTLQVLEKARQLDARMMEQMLKKAGIEFAGLSSTGLAVLMAGLIRVLAAERSLGMTTGHDEVLNYIRNFLDATPTRVSAD